jgi:hypothetical protein
MSMQQLPRVDNKVGVGVGRAAGRMLLHCRRFRTWLPSNREDLFSLSPSKSSSTSSSSSRALPSSSKVSNMTDGMVVHGHGGAGSG